MKKVLAFLLVGMLVFGSMAFASETRIGGLGVQPWQTLDDEAIIYSYVGQLSNYKNLALIEMDAAYKSWGGALLGIADTMNLGIIVGKSSGAADGLLASNKVLFAPGGGLDGVPNATVNSKDVDRLVTGLAIQNQALALYSIDLGDLAVGLGVAYSSGGSSWENKTADTAKDKYSANARGIDVLAGVTMGGIDVGLSVALPSVNVAVDEQRWTGTDSVSDNDEKWDASGLLLNIAGRINLGDALITNLGVIYGSENGKLTIKNDNNNDGDVADAVDINNEYSGENSLIGVNLGISKEIKGNTAKAIAGVILGYELKTAKEGKIKDIIAGVETKGTETNDSTISLVANLGAEAKLNETFSVRGGISKQIVSLSTTASKDLDYDPVIELSSSEDSTSSPVVSAGASMNIGSFTLDGIVSTALLLFGPYFIGGIGTGLNTQIAAKYAW